MKTYHHFILLYWTPPASSPANGSSDFSGSITFSMLEIWGRKWLLHVDDEYCRPGKRREKKNSYRGPTLLSSPSSCTDRGKVAWQWKSRRKILWPWSKSNCERVDSKLCLTFSGFAFSSWSVIREERDGLAGNLGNRPVGLVSMIKVPSRYPRIRAYSSPHEVDRRMNE